MPPPASSGERAIGRVTDVSDESQVEGAMRAAREAFGSLDIVVNCAGFGAIAPLTELSDDKWRAVQAVTLGGVFYGVKHGARQMLEQGRPGVIINISSVNGRQPGEGQVGLLRGQGRRRHAHALRRAGARRPRHPRRRHRARPGGDAADEEGAGRSRDARALPRRDPDEARRSKREEIAAAAVFLASDHARSINGETIAIDGGSLTRGYPALLTGLKKAS